MTANHTSIVIVWPAFYEGSTDSSSHVTALFLGKTGGKFAKAHPNFRERLGAFLEGMTQDPGPVGVDHLGHVGYRNDIPALMLGFQSELADQYAYMYRELAQGGVPIDATYSFSPHVTLSKEGHIPVYDLKSVHLEAPVLWWGNDRPIHSNHKILAGIEAARLNPQARVPRPQRTDARAAAMERHPAGSAL